MPVDFHYVPVPPPDRDFLAGAQAGRRFGQELLAIGRDLVRPCVCVVDFTGTMVATGSWLREAILRVNWTAPQQTPHLYLGLAGCSDDLEEELQLLLESTGNLLTLVDLDQRKPVRARVLGNLTGVLRDAFGTLCRLGRVSASDLVIDGSGLSASAWNNRLSSLHERRILATERPGLARYYEPLFPGEFYGCRLPIQSS